MKDLLKKFTETGDPAIYAQILSAMDGGEVAIGVDELCDLAMNKMRNVSTAFRVTLQLAQKDPLGERSIENVKRASEKHNRQMYIVDSLRRVRNSIVATA